MQSGRESPPDPVVIGIAGPSGAGKSCLASALALRLGEVATLHADDYYRDLSHLPLDERARTDFDDPAAVEHERLADDLAALAAGRAVDAPDYDFTAHVRRGSRRVEPAPWILVDGLFLLCWPEVRQRLDLAVYVDADIDTCLRRRLTRDVVERGRGEESVRRQFERHVLPSRERFLEPSRGLADLVVNGAGEPEAAADAVLLRLFPPEA